MRDMLLLVNLDHPASRSVARKLRGEGYFCLIVSPEDFEEQPIPEGAKGLVLCGGSAGTDCPVPGPERLIAAGLPVLAFGDAALTLCERLGGSTVLLDSAARSVRVSYGQQERLLEGLEEGERYLPNPICVNLPEDTRPVAWVAEGGVIGFALNNAPVYAFAFQVENNDPEGVGLLRAFAGTVCGCEAWWNDEAFIESAIREIREAADGGDAICAISGGVDSAVCAKLGAMALGEKMHCVFVNTGLLREGEAEDIMDTLQRGAGLSVWQIDAREEFIEALRDIRSPKEKEQIIYSRLRAHIRHAVSAMPDVRIFLQGTNYSDVFGSSLSLRQELTGARVRLLEPVRSLFKDEIRRVAQAIRLPESVCRRQPFPSSGLALRIVPTVTEEGVRTLGTADRIVREEIEGAGLNRRLWQYYASLYENPTGLGGGMIVTVRAVQAQERGAVAARLPSDLLERITERVLAELPEVARVYYDLTPSHSYNRMEWS